MRDKKPETKTYRDYANEFMDLCHSKAGYDERQRFLQQKLVSEVEHQAKIKEMQEEFNSYCAKTQANCNHCAVKHTEKIEALEGENAKIKNEIAEERTGNEFLNTENLALMGDCVAYQRT